MELVRWGKGAARPGGILVKNRQTSPWQHVAEWAIFAARNSCMRPYLSRVTVAWLAFLSCLTVGKAQTKTESLVWARYFLTWSFSEKFTFKQELENRVYWFPYNQHQIASRTFLNYKLGGGWQAGLGYTHFFQYQPQDPWAEQLHTALELRPQLELSNKTALNARWSLTHRYWGEFRFFEKVDGAGHAFHSLRLRYALGVQYQRGSATYSLGTEPMLNWGPGIGANIFDQNRLGGGIKYAFAPQWSVEATYLYWHQQLPSGTNFVDRHIIRLTIHHQVGQKK